jgi:hypothetical protein
MSWSWKSDSGNAIVRKTDDALLPSSGGGGSGIASINGDTTSAQTIAAGSGISLGGGTSGGVTTISATGAGGITSINTDTTAAQTIVPGTNVTSTPTVSGATTINVAGTATPTASTLAEWDANKNMNANGFISGLTTLASASTPFALSNTSTQVQNVTGTTLATIVLPDSTTCTVGQIFIIKNSTTVNLFVNFFGGAVYINAMPTLSQASITCVATSGNNGSSWSFILGSLNTKAATVLMGGTGSQSVVSVPAATAWAGWDANKNLNANQFIKVAGTTITSTTSYTLAQLPGDVVVGSATAGAFTITIPANSASNNGYTMKVYNVSSFTITIEISGGASSITTLPTLTSMTVSGANGVWYYGTAASLTAIV